MRSVKEFKKKYGYEALPEDAPSEMSKRWVVEKEGDFKASIQPSLEDSNNLTTENDISEDDDSWLDDNRSTSEIEGEISNLLTKIGGKVLAEKGGKESIQDLLDLNRVPWTLGDSLTEHHFAFNKYYNSWVREVYGLERGESEGTPNSYPIPVKNGFHKIIQVDGRSILMINHRSFEWGFDYSLMSGCAFRSDMDNQTYQIKGFLGKQNLVALSEFSIGDSGALQLLKFNGLFTFFEIEASDLSEISYLNEMLFFGDFLRLMGESMEKWQIRGTSMHLLDANFGSKFDILDPVIEAIVSDNYLNNQKNAEIVMGYCFDRKKAGEFGLDLSEVLKEVKGHFPAIEDIPPKNP
jgi:hypothetical protein